MGKYGEERSCGICSGVVPLNIQIPGCQLGFLQEWISSFTETPDQGTYILS